MSAVLASTPIRSHGFTNEVLGWKAWLETVDLATASPEQIAALEEMSPQAKQSAYFLLLAHQPEMLLQRSIAFNAIMFAPGGMPRAERELGATVESRLNGCVYCASVHAQRFEQLAKRNDVIAQLFEDPLSAGTTPREQAIVRFSAELALKPDALSAEHVRALRQAGLGDMEVLDLVHAVALFAWANRLMLNMGEPIFPEAAATVAA
ncbi:peroxidase-related enzyme [Variovorax sp. RT4R15]|uniref:peroxidase-related enzyme n=1 Tax=Variovorax sp. RT4R15 TaxID=3443737 RepID=UPI003F45FC81